MQVKVIYVFYDVSHNNIFVVLDGSLEIMSLVCEHMYEHNNLHPTYKLQR